VQGIRYAIKLPDGTYSNGPQMRFVPLNKAKLWTNIGHVKTHLQGIPKPYPKGSKIVEVEVVYREKGLCLVEDYLTEHKQAVAEKRRVNDKRHAEMELEAAKKRLADAERRVSRLR
jgi:hypothetical protein